MHNPYVYACTIHIYRQHLTTHILHNNTYSDAADTHPTIQEMLKRNSSEYQHHLSKKEKVNRILQHQQNIRTFQTIPKRYRPTATLETISPNPTLTKNRISTTVLPTPQQDNHPQHYHSGTRKCPTLRNNLTYRGTTSNKRSTRRGHHTITATILHS